MLFVGSGHDWQASSGVWSKERVKGVKVSNFHAKEQKIQLQEKTDIQQSQTKMSIIPKLVAGSAQMRVNGGLRVDIRVLLLVLL